MGFGGDVESPDDGVVPGVGRLGAHRRDADKEEEDEGYSLATRVIDDSAQRMHDFHVPCWVCLPNTRFRDDKIDENGRYRPIKENTG